MIPPSPAKVFVLLEAMPWNPITLSLATSKMHGL